MAMTIRTGFAVSALVALVAATGCDDSPTSPSELMGRMWRLVAIEPASGSSTVVIDPSRYWIEFISDTRISVGADCNTCSGGYTLSGTNVSISPLACTRAFCGEASLDIVFMQSLTEAKTLTLDSQLLEIRSDARTLKLRAE